MGTKENTDLTGKICYYCKEIVLVVEKRKTIIKFSPHSNKYETYNVLFPKGGIDTVSAKNLKIIKSYKSL
jgi:hypothetical protein